MRRRSYGILGTGAVGGYYGARLHHGGHDVRFLLHSDYEFVRCHGLKVESKDGDFSIAEPAAFGSAVDLPPSDVVVVCLKTTHNRLLPELLPPAVKPDGVVVMMQNGLGVEAEAAKILPDNVILGGLAFLCSNKIGPGHIQHLDYGYVRLGQYAAGDTATGITDAVRAVGEDLAAAGLPLHLEEDLTLARWKKLVWNIPYNGMSVVRNCTTDVLMADEATRALCESIMNEVVAAAKACGRNIDASFVQAMLEATDQMASYKPSMKLDHERGLPLEIEAIYGKPLRIAAAAGIACPRIADLRDQLIEIDRGLAR